MADPISRAPRRRERLSRARIVAAATEILDGHGPDALTVRALTSHLATGRGAIYHHVRGLDDLVAAAADEVIRVATERAVDNTDPSSAIRTLALGIFDAIDAHPWVGAQLTRDPGQPAVLRIWTGIATHLAGLGLTGALRSDAGSALANYIFGAAAQFVAGARRAQDGSERRRNLVALAQSWTEHDPGEIVREAATELVDHDDRQQFRAGVDIFLRGVTR